MMLFDYMMTYGRIIATSLGDTAKAVLVNLTGIGYGDDPADGEGSTGEALFGQLGVVARPKSPSKDGHAEVIAARTEDGLQPLVHRDLRLNQRVNPKEGEVDIVQYGGGFLSLADNSEGNGTTAVLYTPELDAGGAIKKAHAVVLDTAPSNSSVSIIHALGMALLMTKEERVIIKNAKGDAYVELGPNGIVLNGNVTLNGGLLAGDPVGAEPLMLAPALLAWVGEVNAAFTQLNAQLVAGLPVLNNKATGPGVAPPAAVPIAATRASAK